MRGKERVRERASERGREKERAGDESDCCISGMKDERKVRGLLIVIA